HALKLRHRDGADEDQHAAQKSDPSDHRDAEHGVVDALLNAADDFAAVDRRDVWIPGDEIVLEASPDCSIVGPLQESDVGMRRALEDARIEADHEAAAARVAPLDMTDARHFRKHLPAQNVKAHVVAD